MRSLLTTALTILLLCGCASSEKYAYLGDVKRNQEMPIVNKMDPVVSPSDQIYIFVYSQEMKSVELFNEETNKAKGYKVALPSYKDTANENNRGTIRMMKVQKTQGYLVSDDGYITFPVLGKIHVGGMTLLQIEQDIQKRLIDGGYVIDPLVTASLMNFRVTVVGEVQTPQIVYGDGNRMTIFEAIAKCGDITMDGIRTNIKVIRINNTVQVIDTVDLTSNSILKSDFYYLQSGDIVYVEPTEKKKKIAYRNEDWPTYLTTGARTLQIAYTLVYRIFYDPRSQYSNTIY